MQFAELLTPAEIARVHDASLDILENVGLLVRNARQEIFARHGLVIDESEIVKLPRSIQDALTCIPPTFTFSRQ